MLKNHRVTGCGHKRQSVFKPCSTFECRLTLLVLFRDQVVQAQHETVFRLNFERFALIAPVLGVVPAKRRCISNEPRAAGRTARTRPGWTNARP